MYIVYVSTLVCNILTHVDVPQVCFENFEVTIHEILASEALFFLLIRQCDFTVVP